MASREVSKERSGFRDQALSERHRLWGWDCPAVDVDFLLIEYDSGKVCALVEYKSESAPSQKASHPSYRAMKDLANRADIPFLVCRYSDQFTRFHVIPMNNYARAYVPDRVLMSESQWVELLYRIRGRYFDPSEIPDLKKETEVNE